MAVSWSRLRTPEVVPARPVDPVVLVTTGGEDDVASAARTWLRLSWLAAMPGLNPLWWLGTAYAAVASRRARSRPFSAEDAIRTGRSLLLAGQAVTAVVAAAAGVALVVTTEAVAAAVAAGPLGAGLALVHAALMGAGVAALTWLLRVAVPPSVRRRDAAAARAFLVLLAVTWAVPVAAVSLVSALA